MNKKGKQNGMISEIQEKIDQSTQRIQLNSGRDILLSQEATDSRRAVFNQQEQEKIK